MDHIVAGFVGDAQTRLPFVERTQTFSQHGLALYTIQRQFYIFVADVQSGRDLEKSGAAMFNFMFLVFFKEILESNQVGTPANQAQEDIEIFENMGHPVGIKSKVLISIDRSRGVLPVK
uniref:Uncharacterized protein n=1 Tax=Romanomermis culicivorax TaxID=13658 RepID=A0A915IBW7_ROMCU